MRVSLKGIDRVGMLNDITRYLSLVMGVNMRKLNLQAEGGLFDGYIDLYVNSRDILDKMIKKLSSIEGIADSVLAYFQNQANLLEIARLQNAGLQFSLGEKAEKKSDLLEGKTIVISGNFSISRDDMKALIEAHSGKNGSSVSSKTTVPRPTPARSSASI